MIRVTSGYYCRILLESENYWPDSSPKRIGSYYNFSASPKWAHVLASGPHSMTLRADGVWVPDVADESITILNTTIITHLDMDPRYVTVNNDTGSLDFVTTFVDGHNRRLSVYPGFNDDKVYANSYYVEGLDQSANTITGYDPVNWKYGIRINGAEKDEEDPDKLLAGQMSLYLPYFNEQYDTKMLLLSPNPTEKVDFYQSLLNGACMWFSC